MSVLIQNKYGEYKPLENERVEASDETQLVYATGFLKAVNDAIDDIKHRSYFIGFRLDEANRYKYYESLGYANIEELAEAEFGFGRSTTYGLMQAFNYAKSETPLYIADKFRGYSYTALLEMSKAKTIRGRGGIERILTPKDSVSKIKEVRPLWDKYITENGELPNCKTIAEFMELVKEQEKPAPAPLLELAEHNEPLETEENRVQSTGLTEPEEIQEEPDEEFETELNEEVPDGDCIKGENYSPFEEYKNVTVRRESLDDEIVEYCLTASRYSVALGVKFEIYDRYLRKEPVPFFRDFVKKTFGNFVVMGNCGTGGYFERLESSEGYGLVIERISGGKLKIGWNTVTGKIMNLIAANKYLTEEEKDRFLQWKAKQDGIVINTEPPTLLEEPEQAAQPSEVQPEQKPRLNLKNDKARREWLENFRAWGVWFEVPQVDKTFYRYDFANGAALIVEVGFEYWSFSSTPGAKERIAYSIIDDKHTKFNSKGISYTDVVAWLTAHAKEI